MERSYFSNQPAPKNNFFLGEEALTYILKNGTMFKAVIPHPPLKIIFNLWKFI